MAKAKTKMIELTNSFHRSRTVIRAKVVGQQLLVSNRQVERARAALCGCQGCLCGNTLGARGCNVNCMPYDNDWPPTEWILTDITLLHELSPEEV